MAPVGRTARQAPLDLLSERGKQMIRVRCDLCDRRGAYRADRLVGLIGDVTGPQALVAIAKMGGCARAIDPPAVNDFHYNEKRCQIKIDIKIVVPTTIGKAMHEGWRGYIVCDRHRQGLKATKPCGVEAVLDLPTLVAALGFDFEIDALSRVMTAPCCGTRSFSLTWYQPKQQPAPVFPKR